MQRVRYLRRLANAAKMGPISNPDQLNNPKVANPRICSLSLRQLINLVGIMVKQQETQAIFFTGGFGVAMIGLALGVKAFKAYSARS
jgi:hypothetical protein